MQRREFLVGAASLVSTLFLGACAAKPAAQPTAQQSGGQPAAAAADKVVELKFVGGYMEAHPTVVNGYKPWIKEVDQKSNGTLKLIWYNPATLAPDKELHNAVVGGTVDIGGVAPIYSPGRFPLTEVVELPFICPSAEAGSLVTLELYKQFPEWRDQFKDAHLLWHWASATFQLHTTKKLVKTLEDLKGMKVVCWSAKTIEQAKLLGASPVEMNPPDTYLALERNMAEGVLCPLAPLRSYKISDAAKYHTIIDMGVSSFHGIINTAKWGQLSTNQQKMLTDLTGVYLATICGKTLDEGAVSDSKLLKESGHTFHKLADAEKERWAKAVQPVHDNWLKDMDAKGHKVAKQLYDTTKRLSEEYGKKTGRGYQD